MTGAKSYRKANRELPDVSGRACGSRRYPFRPWHRQTRENSLDTQHPSSPTGAAKLLADYRSIIERGQLGWISQRPFLRCLGAGGQGVVYLSERRGADGFSLPVALKLFSPKHFQESDAYHREMQRIAQVSSQVAQIQQDNLIDVHDFVSSNGLRLLEMEWVDGFDLQRLLRQGTMQYPRERVSLRRWRDINERILTLGFEKPRLKPGFAIAVFRGCLAALNALHRAGIVHTDIKPANIMLKRSGSVKIIDIGSAYELSDPPETGRCTPAYAAPEILLGGHGSPRADLASLGYVLIEMLSGAQPFAGMKSFPAALNAKKSILDVLPSILPPEEIAYNELLTRLVRKLVHPDPAQRFESAEEADLSSEGAAEFQNLLVKGDLSSEYEMEIRHWMEEIEQPNFDTTEAESISESFYLDSTRMAEIE